MKKARTVLALAAVLGLSVSAAHASDPLSADLLSPVAKVDNGLGSLPPLSEWREPWLYAMPAEKLDSGLGALTSMPATPVVAHARPVAR